MDIQIAALCDAATDYSGKLNILGTFDTIVSGQLPAIHPQCSIALRVIFEKTEEGTHKLRLNLVNDDGKSVMPTIEAPFDVVVPADANFISRNFIINIQHLKFDSPGHFAVDVALDGQHQMSVPLWVRYMPAPQLPV